MDGTISIEKVNKYLSECKANKMIIIMLKLMNDKTKQT